MFKASDQFESPSRGERRFPLVLECSSLTPYMLNICIYVYTYVYVYK